MGIGRSLAAPYLREAMAPERWGAGAMRAQSGGSAMNPRDGLRDEAYFTSFVAKTEQSISHAKEGLLREGADGRRGYLARYNIAREELTVIFARYSRGDAIDSIGNSFSAFLDDWLSAPVSDSCVDVIRVCSLASLLGTGRSGATLIEQHVRSSDGASWDWLFGFILGLESAPPDRAPSAWKMYRPLTDVVYADGRESRQRAMKRYLRYWYQRHQCCWWWGYDKKTDVDLYFGYWAVEAAAVARRLGMDDAPLRKSRYYPYDLAHFLDGREGRGAAGAR